MHSPPTSRPGPQDVRNTEPQVTHLLSLNPLVAENDPWIVKGVFLEEPIFQRFWMKKQALHVQLKFTGYLQELKYISPGYAS